MNIKTNLIKLILLIICCIAFGQSVKAESHWLDFNPYGFSTEFFRANSALRGSCGAAAVVLVENHLNLRSSIASDAVKNKNTQMLADPTASMRPTLSGMYYISSIDGIGTRLQRDGYKVNWLGSTNRQTAAKNIFAALARKRWVIIVARHNFVSTNAELGHFYPIYGGDLKMVNSSTVNETTSTLNAIDDFYGFREFYNSNYPVWNDMYKRGVNLKQVLNSMYSSSCCGNYNIIEVWK